MSRDPDHWLWRLSAEEWLAAAVTERNSAGTSLNDRRRCLVHLRRAAGMSINAYLVASQELGAERELVESCLGRSYVEHLGTLAEGGRIEALHASLRRGPSVDPARPADELAAGLSSVADISATASQAPRPTGDLAVESGEAGSQHPSVGELLSWPDGRSLDAAARLLSIPTIANARRLVTLGRQRHAELEDAVGLCTMLLEAIAKAIGSERIVAD